MRTKHGDEPVADFTVLDGVGNKTAKALVRAGVTTMSQLAKANVYELVERLEEVGASVAPGRIVSQRWLFQAWERASKESTGTGAGSEEPTGEAGDDTAGVESESEWVEQASFIVSFESREGFRGAEWQTRVWDTGGLVEEVVAGTDADDWAPYVVNRVRPDD